MSYKALGKTMKNQGGVWESSLSYVVWVFLIYVWVKKCVEMCVMLFKMCSFVFEMACQTGQLSRNPTRKVNKYFESFKRFQG